MGKMNLLHNFPHTVKYILDYEWAFFLWTAVKRGHTEKSAVAEHVWLNLHSIVWDHVKILDQDSMTSTRRIRQALDIRKHSNLMNRDEGVDVSHIWDLLLFSN